MEESIVIVDKDKADEIEGLKSEVRNATEVITNKTATIVVKTEQVHLTREELLQTRIALMAKYLIHIISSCKLEIEEFESVISERVKTLNSRTIIVPTLKGGFYAPITALMHSLIQLNLSNSHFL